MSDLSTNPSPLESFSNEALELKTMGGEKTTPKPLLKPGKGKGVFDVAISRLLKDFTSAELLSQTSDSSPKGTTNPNQDTKYETIVSSMKCLHLQRPIIAKERKKGALKRKHLQNSLNLAVAASHFQKPIVWPAKLSSQCKKESSQLINPPRLEISQKETGGKYDATNIKSTVSSEESENSVIIFGSLASSDYSKVSFSNLSEQVNSGGKTDIFKNCSFNESSFLTFDETLSPLLKRHSSGSIPPAKIKKIDDCTGDTVAALPVFSEYRSVVKDCLLPKSNATSFSCGPEPSLASEAFRPCSSSASLEAIATPSSLCASAQVSQWEGSINRSCSQEMRVEETNVNELASYFEDLLHIPRKMSTMAEMMYA